MASETKRRKDNRSPAEWTRPSWVYTRTADFPGYESATLEMMESCRNALEAIRSSQMLQCDVARNIDRMRIAIERIDRRLAKTVKL